MDTRCIRLLPFVIDMSWKPSSRKYLHAENEFSLIAQVAFDPAAQLADKILVVKHAPDHVDAIFYKNGEKFARRHIRLGGLD